MSLSDLNGLSAMTARALQHRLAVGQHDGRVPSAVASVARRGEPVWFGAAGLVDGAAPTADTQYRIGSITKTMVAVCVLGLVERGDITLDDPLGLHLPDAPAADATVWQLLTHTAGLASETPPPWWERTAGTWRPALRDVLPEDPRRHPAGRVHHYSNPGFGLLGELVSARAGRRWFDVLTEQVLVPLGMTRTGYRPSPPHARGWAVHPWADVVLPEPAHDAGLLAGAGQIWSTPDDLCRFGVFLGGDGAGILSADTVQLMRTPAVAPDDSQWSGSYGLGVQHVRVDDRVLFGHSGSMPGFLAGMFTSAQDGLTVALLTNAWSAFSGRQIVADLLRIVRDAEPTMPNTWTPTETVDRAAWEVIGPWYWGAVAMAITLRGDGDLELGDLRGRGTPARFTAAGHGRWRGLDGYYHGEFLEPRRDDTGAITHLDLGSFILTRQPYAPADVIPDGLGLGGWRLG